MKSFPRGRIRMARIVRTPMTNGSHCMKMMPKIMPYELSVTVMSPKPSGRESLSQQARTASRATLTCGNAITNHPAESPLNCPNQIEAIAPMATFSTVRANTA